MNRLIASLLLTLLIVPIHTNAQQRMTELTNEMIWLSRKFTAESIYSVHSMNDGEHFSVLDNNKIIKYSYTDFDKAVGVIYDGGGHGLKIDDYSFNSDETKLLVAINQTSIYRRSSKADYYIIDLVKNTSTQLYDKGSQMLADFSPDGNKVAFVYENNIYYKTLADGQVVQVTNDGKQNAIINGSTDWVYEEEFEVTKAFYWSPKGDNIAFLKFDETKVKDFSLEYNSGETYPRTTTFKYPKAGEDNSKLSLFIYSLQNKKSQQVNTSDFEYIARMKWSTADDKLIFLGMNRHQNQLSYVVSEFAPNGSIVGRAFYTDKSETYVEVDNNLLFLEDGSSFLRTSEKSGYRHIYQVDFNGVETQITSGDWDVVELKGIDQKKKTIYYTSAEEGAIYQSLYSISLDGKNKTKLSTRLGHNDADFSLGMKYYINYYSNANEPYEITLNNSKGKQINVLKDNRMLKERLEKYNFNKKEFIKIKGVEHELNAFIIKPKDFDPKKQYPVYFDIYNGPGHNTVVDKWGGSNYFYHQLLAQKGYIVISVDTRGTMNRGTAFKNSTYMQLGKLETEDMIAVAKVVGKWDYVDIDRLGIMGWSYGGYMSSLCMTKGADVFKMGIAVAPVTNWRWYDNIYTERFMRTPQENPTGYDDNSPINHVNLLKGKYLIIHGSGDDNVHIQNTMEMTNALIKNNVDFDMFIYPNRNHSINGGNTRVHLFNKLLAFTLENL